MHIPTENNIQIELPIDFSPVAALPGGALKNLFSELSKINGIERISSDRTPIYSEEKRKRIYPIVAAIGPLNLPERRYNLLLARNGLFT